MEPNEPDPILSSSRYFLLSTTDPSMSDYLKNLLKEDISIDIVMRMKIQTSDKDITLI